MTVIKQDKDVLTIGSMDWMDPFVKAILAGYENPNTKRTYTRALREFMGWLLVDGLLPPPPVLNKMVVNSYKDHLVQAGTGSHSINQRLTAIKRLAEELMDNGVLDMQTVMGIRRVKPIRIEGKPVGNWLTKEQAQALLDAPDITTMAGLRDRALLAVLVGCGLRRSEAASLTFEHVQEREGRWAIVDLVGKRNKVRTVLMASWVYKALREWFVGAALLTPADKLFMRVDKGDALYIDVGIHPDSVGLIVRKYAKRIGVDIAPHDIRRTFARLTWGAGADLSQIQLDMGHDSVETTMRYIGAERDWHDAPSDRLPLKL